MGKETVEEETVAGDTRLHEGGHEGSGAGQALHLNAFRHTGAHEQETGVGDARGAGVAHQRHTFRSLDLGDNRVEPFVLVEDVIGHASFIYLKVFQQVSGSAGVLAEDEVHRAEHIEGAQRDVFQIADGGRHDIEFHCGRIWSAKIHKKT